MTPSRCRTAAFRRFRRVDRDWDAGEAGTQGGRSLTGVAAFGAVNPFPLSAAVSAAVFEAPGVVAGLDDIAVVGQPIEHGGRHLGVAKDLGPIGEGEIGGDQQRGVFVKLADQVEQQLPT